MLGFASSRRHVDDLHRGSRSSDRGDVQRVRLAGLGRAEERVEADGAGPDHRADLGGLQRRVRRRRVHQHRREREHDGREHELGADAAREARGAPRAAARARRRAPSCRRRCPARRSAPARGPSRALPAPTRPMPGPCTRRRLHAAIPTTTRNAPTFSEQQRAVVGAPQRAERLELADRLERPGQHEHDHRAERDAREPARHRRVRDVVVAREPERDQTADPDRHREHVQHVRRRTRARPTVRWTRGRRARASRRARRRRPSSRRRGRVGSLVATGAHDGADEETHHHEQHEPQHVDLAEARVPRGRDQVGGEHVADAAAGRVRALEQEPEHRAEERQLERAVEHLAHAHRDPARRPEEQDEADDAEQQREPDEDAEAHHAEQDTDRAVARLGGLGLGRELGGGRAGGRRSGRRT